MKRLLWYLNQINDSGTTTFRYTVNVDGSPVQKEIYDGECVAVHLKPNGERITDRTFIRREPTYWQNDIAYTFERTNRMSVSRPTVIAAIPVTKLGIRHFTPAAADYCLRRINPYFDRVNAQYANKARPDSDNGKFVLYQPGGEVLTRNAAYFAMRPGKGYTNGKGCGIFVTEYADPVPDRMCLCIRMEIQLPHGKLKRAKKMLTIDLPGEVERYVREFRPKENDSYPSGLRDALLLEHRQNEIRSALRERGYCAFIANGSVLAREKGTQLPMRGALPFTSPPDDEVEIAGVRGMGIKRGVTVITGGGYSGKSTVLNAISAGIYNHTPGDGRELCVTDDSAVTITAEDGRAVSSLNISPFIKWLPAGDAKSFSTSHASGSTSQAANIMEAVESGAALLLIDEDRSATNFMIRDSVMKALIKNEPITPFTDRVRELAANGVSTVLVIGGSGEYLNVADKVYMMDEYKMSDVTVTAKELAGNVNRAADASVTTLTNTPHGLPSADWSAARMMSASGFTSYPENSGTERLEVSDTGFIIIGDELVDMRALHDIATPAQTDTLAFMLRYLMNGIGGEVNELERIAMLMRGITRESSGHLIDMAESIRELFVKIETEGFDLVNTGFFTGMNRFLDMPRAYELRAVINRMRRIKFINVAQSQL